MVMGLASRFGGFYHDPNVDQEKILLERKQKIREKGNYLKPMDFPIINDYKESKHMHQDMIRKEIMNTTPFTGLVEKFLEGPSGTEFFKKFLNGPEGKKIIDNEIESKFKEIESSFVCDMSREINDFDAESEIKTFLRGLKEQGLVSANLLDIIMATNLPSEQIERIMDRLKRD